MITVPPALVDAIGYVASALVVLSLAMTSVVRLRILSLLGSAAYVAYGAVIGAWPVVIANAAIVVLNIWNLAKELRRPGDLGAVPIDCDAPFLADFLHHHLHDIHRHEPGFDPAEADTAYVYMREGMPAGAVMGVRDGQTLALTLDYVLPTWRDSRLGTWLFGEGCAALKRDGIVRVTATPSTPVQRDYLLGVGFEPDTSGRLAKTLP